MLLWLQASVRRGCTCVCVCVFVSTRTLVSVRGKEKRGYDFMISYIIFFSLVLVTSTCSAIFDHCWKSSAERCPKLGGQSVGRSAGCQGGLSPARSVSLGCQPPFCDTPSTAPHPGFSICIKGWQAANFLLIKHDHFGGCQAAKGIYNGS